MDTVNPVEPIDMADQERIKLERKRHRNRIAASKCRQRKLIRISKLEKKVDKYNSKISNLKNWNQIIQDALAKLNSHIAAHRNAGCEISLVMSSWVILFIVFICIIVLKDSLLFCLTEKQIYLHEKKKEFSFWDRKNRSFWWWCFYVRISQRTIYWNNITNLERNKVERSRRILVRVK